MFVVLLLALSEVQVLGESEAATASSSRRLSEGWVSFTSGNRCEGNGAGSIRSLDPKPENSGG